MSDDLVLVADVEREPVRWLWPARRGDVILLSAEDDISDTIRPRLEAAGADLSRCWVLPDVQPEPDRPPRPPELPADLDALEGMVKDKAAALVAYVGAQVVGVRGEPEHIARPLLLTLARLRHG